MNQSILIVFKNIAFALTPLSCYLNENSRC